MILFRHALDIEAKVDDVAFLHDVLFAFQSEQALFTRGSIGACAHQLVVADDLGADKAALDVGVNRARGLRRACPLRNCPGAQAPMLPRVNRACSDWKAKS